MAKIIALAHPDNVTLASGCMQHWHDLQRPGPSSAAPVRDIIRSAAAGANRILFAGPHEPALVAELAANADVVAVTRAIPDAAAIGEAAPSARVIAGSLVANLDGLGEFDLVVVADDLTRVASLEEPTRDWGELLKGATGLLSPTGRLVLAAENELGLPRWLEPRHPQQRISDADWAPFETWDASRPRTPEQLAGALADLGLAGEIGHLLPTWGAASAVAYGLGDGHSPLNDWAAVLAVRPSGWDRGGAEPVLAVRTLAMADRMHDAAAGWIVVASRDGAVHGEARVAADGKQWRAAGDGLVTDGERRLAVPPHGETLANDLVVASAEGDLPGIRRVLREWRAALDAVAVDGNVPAEFADARFSNLIRADGGLVHVQQAPAELAMDEVLWTALSHFLTMLRTRGMRTAWPSNMHPHTMLETLGAMAGLDAPQDIARYVDPLVSKTPNVELSRQELIAGVDRRDEQLKSAWARVKWDEKQYFLFKAQHATKRVIRAARNDSPKKLAGKVARRIRKLAP